MSIENSPSDCRSKEEGEWESEIRRGGEGGREGGRDGERDREKKG